MFQTEHVTYFVLKVRAHFSRKPYILRKLKKRSDVRKNICARPTMLFLINYAGSFFPTSCQGQMTFISDVLACKQHCVPQTHLS